MTAPGDTIHWHGRALTVLDVGPATGGDEKRGFFDFTVLVLGNPKVERKQGHETDSDGAPAR